MNVRESVENTQKKLEKAGISSAKLDSQIIHEHILSIDRAFLEISKKSLSDEESNLINSATASRLRHRPLAYLTNVKEFYGLDFYVDENVLIPRAETEVLVEYITTHAKNKARVLEIGTGSGCISVAIKHSRGDIEITASDISAEALSVAARNSLTNGVEIEFIQSNMFENIKGKFDIICANLPYVDDSKKKNSDIKWEPELALFSGKDGLDLYRRLFEEVKGYLKPNGLIIIEHDPTQLAEIEKLAGQKPDSLSPYISLID